MILRSTLLCGLLATAQVAAADTFHVSDTFHVTDAERAACAQDAERLCASTYPDEQQLFSCMKANRASLGPTCLPVFDAGVKRRGL